MFSHPSQKNILQDTGILVRHHLRYIKGLLIKESYLFAPKYIYFLTTLTAFECVCAERSSFHGAGFLFLKRCGACSFSICYLNREHHGVPLKIYKLLNRLQMLCNSMHPSCRFL